MEVRGEILTLFRVFLSRTLQTYKSWLVQRFLGGPVHYISRYHEKWRTSGTSSHVLIYPRYPSTWRTRRSNRRCIAQRLVSRTIRHRGSNTPTQVILMAGVPYLKSRPRCHTFLSGWPVAGVQRHIATYMAISFINLPGCSSGTLNAPI